jgi:hypothetical protein
MLHYVAPVDIVGKQAPLAGVGQGGINVSNYLGRNVEAPVQ